MKILYVITRSEQGGHSNFLRSLGLYFSKEHEIGILTGEDWDDYLHREVKQAKHYIFPSLKRSYNIFSALTFAFLLLKLVRKEKYSLVHLNSSNTLIAAPFLRFFSEAKTAFTVHGLSFLDPNHVCSRALKFFLRLWFRVMFFFLDRTIFVSSRDYAEAERQKILNSSGIVIRNGIEASYKDPDEAREIFGRYGALLDDNAFVVGSVGRLAYPKNQMFIIRTFPSILEKIPRARYIIMGEGPDRENLEKEIYSHGLEKAVFLLGSVSDAGSLISGLDIFILPSVYEGMSLALLEALGSGANVLASRSGGNPEVLSSVKSALYEPDDTDDFIQKFLFLYSDQGGREKQKEVLKDLSKEFDVNTMIKKYQELYQSLITSS